MSFRIKSEAFFHLTNTVVYPLMVLLTLMMYPAFIYVDGPSGHVHSEGTAGSWEQALSLLQDALLDAIPGREGDGSAERIRRADTELAVAGIHPGHPSLWGNEPTRDAGEDGHGQR